MSNIYINYKDKNILLINFIKEVIKDYLFNKTIVLTQKRKITLSSDLNNEDWNIINQIILEETEKNLIQYIEFLISEIMEQEEDIVKKGNELAEITHQEIIYLIQSSSKKDPRINEFCHE